MPRVSVIIPSFNHEKYIVETIRSVLDQTFQDFEIIIVDDASTDNTVSEIKKFNDKRIKLSILEKNHGASYAANKCIRKSRGEYIALLSSDDIFIPTKLEKQVNFLDQHSKIAAVFSYAQIIDEYGKDFSDRSQFYSTIFNQSNRNRFQWLNYFFHNGNCLCHPSLMMRKKIYETIGFYDDRLAQIPDLDYWIRLCLKYEIHIIPENLIKFRVRKDEKNTSADRPETSARHAWELVHVLKTYLNVQAVSDLLKIFPEVIKFDDSLHSNLIKFYIAMLALERKWAPYQLFAIEVLYEMLGSKNVAKDLEEKHHFKYSDFIKLTGTSDVMNFFEIHYRDDKIDHLESKIKLIKESKLYKLGHTFKK